MSSDIPPKRGSDRSAQVLACRTGAVIGDTPFIPPGRLAPLVCRGLHSWVSARADLRGCRERAGGSSVTLILVQKPSFTGGPEAMTRPLRHPRRHLGRALARHSRAAPSATPEPAGHRCGRHDRSRAVRRGSPTPSRARPPTASRRRKTPEGRGMDILRSIGTRETPQHRRASAGQVPNSAGLSLAHKSRRQHREV